ncbi:hypothetical protein [[Pseudopropionibacterium] massiliense]|uniref:hypothetical protein n=1 Tax=[Pseudopropionibacterium] massiliense TaxID=2220000 RepID=UPI00103214C8|nr:hypothetical protein [[Pseudopropionibacterium] massiliense]
MIRNFFAAVLLLIATLCALAGSVLQWTDRTAGSPDPTRQLVQEIARDETVRGAATDTIRSSIEQRFPDSVDKVPGLRTTLKSSIDAGVGAAMSDAEVQSAWELTLNDTRATLLKDLTDYGSGRTRTPPSVTINLDPLISRVWQNIRSTAGSDVSDLMDRIELPSGVQVKVADIPAQQADQASQILALASYWWLFHVAAGLLLVGGLLLGTRIGRWVLLAVFSLLGMLAIVATRGMSGMITVPNRGNQLIWALENRITNHLTASLASSLDPLWYGYLGLMVVGLVVAVVKSVRKPA